MGNTISTQINSEVVNPDWKNIITMTLVKNTHALPSTVLSYFIFEKRAYVLYFSLPNLTPTGSARPSPIPFTSIGINNKSS